MKIRELGFLHFGGGEDEGNVDEDIMCEEIGGILCRYAGYEDSGQSMGALNYFAQLYTSERF